MATVTTSIGSNSSIDTETTSSCSGTGPWVVTYGTAPTGVSVGDLAVITDESTYYSDFYYIVTAVSGADITLRYLTDDSSNGDTSPCDLYDMEFNLAPTTFKRMYSTITLWEASLDDEEDGMGTPAMYTSGDDAVGECYDDSTFDEQITISSGETVGLDSVKLSVASGERHDGRAAQGARIVKSTDWSTGILYANYDMHVTLEWLEINAGGNTSDSGSPLASVVGLGGITTDASYRKVINNMVIHNANFQNVSAGMIIRQNAATPWTVMNNIIYDLEVTQGEFGTDRIIDGIGNRFGLSATNYLLNNTIYKLTNNTPSGHAYGIMSQNVATETAKNNIIMDPDFGSTSGGEKCFYSTTLHDWATNLTSDNTATGTGGIIDKAAADQFVSTVAGSEDLLLKVGSDAIGTGTDLATTPTGVNIDICGIDRNALTANIWDIGVHQKRQTASIGTSSRDYTTMTLWEAGLDDEVIYGSSRGYILDVVGECYDDSVFDEDVLLKSTGSNIYASHFYSLTLTAAATERHDGTAGTGVRIVRTASYNALVFLDAGIAASNQGACTVEWLEINGNENGATGSYCVGVGAYQNSSVREHQVVANCLITAPASPGYYVRGINAHGRALTVLNCIVYEIVSAEKVGFISSINAFGIAGDDKMDILNCTVHHVEYSSSYGNTYGIGDYTTNDSDVKIQNCIATGTVNSSGTGEDYADMSSAGTANYNLSSDATATGTGSLTSKASTNQFVSIVVGSEDLHLKDGADALRAGVDLGTTPTGVNIDIDGRDRDAEGDDWDMGADQCEACTPASETATSPAFLLFVE